jgi:hypothetical protein
MPGWSGWGALGGQLAGGSPVVGRNADGRLEAFALSSGPAGPQLVHLWQTSPGGDWSDWDNLGAPPGSFLGALSLGENADGHLEVFGRVGLMSVGALWHLWQTTPNDGWEAWSDLGGGIGPQVLVVGHNTDGRLEVFAVSTYGSLWHIWQDSSTATGWSSWADLGTPPTASLTQGIAVERNMVDGLEVFAAGSDGAVWHIWQESGSPTGWSDWQTLGLPGGTSLAVPTVGRNADTRLEVFAIGGNALWHNWQETGGNWFGWASLGTPPGVAFLNTPRAGSNQDGHLEVFAFGTNDAVWHIWQDASSPNGWSSWDSLGGEPGGAVDVVQNADGRLEVFAESRLPAGPQQLWHRWQTSPNNGWSFVENWELVLPGPASRLYTPAGGAVFARTDAGLFRSTDHAGTWSSVPLPGTPGRVEVDPTNASVLYAGSANTVQKSTNGGASWASVLSLGGAFETVLGIAVSPADPQLVYLGAGQPVNDFRFLRSTNGGGTWTTLEGPLPTNLCTWTVLILAPHPTNANRAFRTLGCYAGRNVPFGDWLRTTTNQGTSWSDLFHETPYFPDHLVGGAGANANRYYLSSHFAAPPGGGKIFRSDNDAATWTGIKTMASGPAVGGLAYNPAQPDVVYAGFTDGTVQSSTDAGATWDNLGQAGLGGMSDLKLSLDTEYLYAATQLGVWRLHL